MEEKLQQLETAFSEKYRQYGIQLYRLSIAYMGNSADAEDVLQEAFIRLLSRVVPFHDEEHEKRWLIRVTINLCKNALKSSWRKRQVPLDDVGLVFLDDGERELLQVLLGLPEIYKSALYLHDIAGYSVQETAAILHVSQSAVKMRLARGREKLRLEWEGTE